VSSIGPPHARHTFAPARAEGSSLQFAIPQSFPLPLLKAKRFAPKLLSPDRGKARFEFRQLR
jgi:hypothetical protein